MRKIILALILLGTLSACQEQEKMGFIDNKKVVNEYHKKKDFEQKFQVKIDNLNKKADSLQQAIQIEAELFRKRAGNMSKKKAEEEYNMLLQKKQMQDYQLSNEDKTLQAEGQAKIDSLVTEVKTFVKEYGKTNGYTFIFGANEAGSVLYGDDAKDLTEDVLTKLNEASGKDAEEKK